jgi:hypothetical protein
LVANSSNPCIATSTKHNLLFLQQVFLFVRPAGRTHSEVKVLYSPDRGKS